MTIPIAAEIMQIVDALAALRDIGVCEFVSGDFRVTLTAALPSSIHVSPVSTSQTTPEQSGTADMVLPPPKKDIFDVLSDGMIPGAPTRDGLPGDPDTDPGP